MIASWTEDTATSTRETTPSTLELIIEPRGGFTQKLLRYAKTHHPTGCLALFSGPHGQNIPVGDYGSVLMISSGYGIAAQLPYLKELLRGYNNRQIRTRKIHLIWQVNTLGTSLLLTAFGATDIGS